MAPRNPFTPSFGVSPPLLVGRAGLIEEFGEGLDDGPGAPGRATLFTGPRGMGKTVMLNATEHEARRRGWLVISESATKGLLDRMVTEHLPGLLRQVDPRTTGRRATAASVGGLGSVGWEHTDAHPVASGLRNQINRLTDLLTANETGLLITVDELHRGRLDDLTEICSVIQHSFREERQVAFAGAGLPAAVRDLLNEDPLTFLIRADRHVLGAVSLRDVADALRLPIETSGRTITNGALARAASSTAGYPFLIQLVGYHLWRQHPSAVSISRSDADAGMAAAARRIGSLVYEPALKDTSAVDRSFLVAMALDDGPSRMADIAERLGTDGNYAGQYRIRLLQHELIHSPWRGFVDFSLPYLREYLRDHAASLVSAALPLTPTPAGVEAP